MPDFVNQKPLNVSHSQKKSFQQHSALENKELGIIDSILHNFKQSSALREIKSRELDFIKSEAIETAELIARNHGSLVRAESNRLAAEMFGSIASATAQIHTAIVLSQEEDRMAGHFANRDACKNFFREAEERFSNGDLNETEAVIACKTGAAVHAEAESRIDNFYQNVAAATDSLMLKPLKQMLDSSSKK